MRCARCGGPYDEVSAVLTEDGMVCQACHQTLAAAERSPDTQSDAVRRCPTCGELTARLVMVTSHVRTVTMAGVPVGEGSQGASFDYACDQCGHGFALLSKKRRLWLWYGVVVGALMGGFMLIDAAAGMLFAAFGAFVAAGTGGWLLFDSSLRRKSQPRGATNGTP